MDIPGDHGAAPYWRPLAVILGGGLFVVAVIVLLVAWVIEQGQADAHREAEITTTNLARVLAEDMRSLSVRMDLSILAIIDDLDGLRGSGRWSEAGVDAILARHDDRNPDLVGFRFFGPDGKLRNAVKNVVNRQADASQDPDFLYLRGTRDAKLVISPPLFGPTVQAWVIRMGRRFNNPDGSFAGAVFTSVTVESLNRLFSTLELGKGGTVALYHSTFRLAARIPASPAMTNPIGQALISDQLRKIIASGRASVQYDYHSTVDGVARTANVRKIDGAPYWILVGLAEDDYLAEVRQNRNRALAFGGGCILLVLLATTVSARKTVERLQTEEKLSRSERRMRLFFERQLVGMAITSPEKGWLQVNERLCEMLGFTREELARLTWAEVTHPDDLGQDVAHFEGMLADRIDEYAMEKRFIRKDGTIIHTDLAVGCVRRPDRSLDYVLALIVDITARKKSEAQNAEASRQLAEQARQLEAKNVELEQFAYIASHDLREPLRMIANYLTLIEKRCADQLTGDTRKYFNYAIGGAKRMDRLILDLLEYSRIGRVAADQEPVALGELVTDSLQILSMAIEESAARISVDEDLPTVTGHRSELGRLFVNLIGNAIKYRLPDRSPEIHVGARRDDAAWTIWVRDNGIGILPEHRDRAFKIFQRLVAREAYEGTGMGLAISRKIVENHGGRIWIEDAPESGTMVMIRLPAVLPIADW